jgi:hypothetical protein
MRKEMSAVELHASWALKYVHEILQAMEREIGRMGLLSVHAATALWLSVYLQDLNEPLALIVCRIALQCYGQLQKTRRV